MCNLYFAAICTAVTWWLKLVFSILVSDLAGTCILTWLASLHWLLECESILVVLICCDDNMLNWMQWALSEQAWNKIWVWAHMGLEKIVDA